MECNFVRRARCSYCKRARFADRNVPATRLGSISGERRPNCVLTMIPPSPQRMHKGGAAGEWDGRDPRPTREQVRFTDC